MKLKSIISIILAFLFILPLAACGGEEEKVKSIDELVEKYKRADYTAFVEDPKEFLKDFETVNYINTENEEDLKFLDQWEKESNDYYDKYEKEAVLFNQSVILCALVNDWTREEKPKYSCSINIEFDSGNITADFALAQVLTDTMIELYGDPTYIEIKSNEASEAQLRKLFSADPETFTVSFPNENTSSVYFSIYGGVTVY